MLLPGGPGAPAASGLGPAAPAATDAIKPKHPGGRPATGRTTSVVTLRLQLATARELHRRAAKAGLSVAAYAALILQRELRHRPGEATRKRQATATTSVL